jgi:hypothetical protein
VDEIPGSVDNFVIDAPVEDERAVNAAPQAEGHGIRSPNPASRPKRRYAR